MANPGGLCKCGCGQKTNIAKHNSSQYGWAKGQPVDFIKGHSSKGRVVSQECRQKLRLCHAGKPLTEQHKKAISRTHPRGPNNPAYNGGLWIEGKSGRCIIRCRDGKGVYYYRAVMENILGRPLLDSELVHHINGNPADDSPENLQLTIRSVHSSFSNKKYTKDIMLQALKDFVAEYGKRPTVREWKETIRQPEYKTYVAYFGSWKNALREAGLCA